MKIKIENSNNVSIVINNLPDHSSRETVKMFAGEMHKLISMMYGDESENVVDVVKSVTSEVPVSHTPSESNDFVIRPRIPNNVVDIKDLTIEKAVTENALVRCPSCGQAHCLAVPSGNHIYLMRRNLKDNEFGIIAEFDSLAGQDFINVCCKPETDRKAYYEDLQSMSFEDNTDFAVNNNTEIFCPVCCTSSTFNLWKDAFENPLDFFETEQLCDACGGEKLEKLIKKHKVYQCDKCGLQTDFKEE